MARRRPGQAVVAEPGVSGLLGGAEDPFARLLVTDDRAEPVRGRGLGTAMTAPALRHARERGACRACLTATAAGQGIYERLGFEVAAIRVDCFRAGP